MDKKIQPDFSRTEIAEIMQQARKVYRMTWQMDKPENVAILTMKYPTNKPTQAQIKVAKEAFDDRKLDELPCLRATFCCRHHRCCGDGYSEPQGPRLPRWRGLTCRCGGSGSRRNTELEMGELAHRLFLETIEHCAQVATRARSNNE